MKKMLVSTYHHRTCLAERETQYIYYNRHVVINGGATGSPRRRREMTSSSTHPTNKDVTIMFIPSMMRSGYDIQGQAVITTFAVCVGATLVWWLRRRQWLHQLCLQNHSVSKINFRNNVEGVMGSGDAAATDANDDVKCNDPNCLRCHSSSSQRHIQAFYSNVILLRRLVKLEPHLFEGMREELGSSIDVKLKGLELLKHQESSRLTSIFSRDNKNNNNLMARFRTWMMREPTLSYPPPSFSTCTQAGQNPTVFFLPGLETTPLHDESHCSGGNSCPCLRLWKTEPIEKMKDENKTSPSKKKYRPIVSATGDINALQSGFDIIRRELLEFLTNNCTTTTNKKNEDNININININSKRTHHDQSSEEERACFQPFDPKVYTHASGKQPQPQPEWSCVYLYHRGVRQSYLCDKYFPQTMHILETQCSHRMAGKCGLGSVYFSKLGRNTKVKEHCGPTNVRWRCHLPLIVPRCKSSSTGDPKTDSSHVSHRKSFLRVGLTGVNERCVGWEEGKPILFDDSFLHSAVHYGGDTNDSDEAGFPVNHSVVDDNRNSENITTNNNLHGARIVLIIDFWHPSLSEMDRTALGVLYPPGS
jgi:hypothetical protein